MKKYLAILVALLLLVAVGVIAVSAETQMKSDSVYCERCKKNISAEEWMEWTATGGDVTKEGHYYLSDTFVAQEATVNIPSIKFICFDLRGNTWATENIRPLNIDGDFSIMDSVGGGLILTTGAHLQDGGFANINNGGALNIYGGTIQRIVREDVTLYHGGLINIAGGTMNVYGGTITGGEVKGITVSGSTKTPRGGNIYMAGGTLNISGGTISNGVLLLGAATYGQGGNIYAAESGGGMPGQITITGGEVKDGYSDWDGGNFYLGKVALTLSGTGEISGGHAIRQGGNISATNAGTAISLLGGSVTGGVAGGLLKDSESGQSGGGGGNIYGYMGTLHLDDTTVDGNIRLDSTMTSVKLSGVVKIGLGTTAGMILAKGMAVDVNELESGSEIFVRTYGGAFTKAIPADKLETIFGYFKGAVRTELTMDTTANTINAAQGKTGYCPHCYDPANPQTVTWTSGIGSGESATAVHYYLTALNSSTSQTNYYNTVVLDLNGYTMKRTGNRLVLLTASTTFTLMDSCGGGRLIGTGTGVSNDDGAIIQHAAKNTNFVLLSGNMIMNTGSGTSMVLFGGVINAATEGSCVTIKGGTITGGSLAASGATGGGNIRLNTTVGTLTVTAGVIRNGTATGFPGGNIYSLGKVDIQGGVILGGTASTGGNIYTTKEVKVSGGIIYGGTATSSSGNIYTTKATISGGVIACGKVTGGNGGNIRMSEANSSVSGNAVIHSGKAVGNGGNIICIQKMTLNIQGGLIAGGVATSLGGNIRQNSGDSNIKITGGVIAMGSANNGGNAYLNNGTVEMTSGKVIAGTAAKGGNFYFNNNVIGKFKDDGDPKTALPVISHGKATGGNGGNIAFMATGNSSSLSYYMQLGNCKIYGGTASGSGNNVYINNLAVLQVLPEFAQQTSIYFHKDLVQNEIYLDNTKVTCDGLYSGTLLFENKVNLPKIITTQNDPTLVIGQAALVMADGTTQWYGSNAEAVAAYNQNVSYLQPASGEIALPIGTFVVDLVGQDVTFTGSAETGVYCFDSINTNYISYGKAKFNGPVLKNTLDYAINDTIYVTIAESEENTYGFHCLGMRVSSVSFRPVSAGIYYSCTWECDSVLQTKLDKTGVAVSTVDMPDAGFATDKDTLFTQASAADTELGKEYNSVLINKIFSKTANNNTARGETRIYATPYVTLVGGQSITCPGECAYSLQGVLELFDGKAYYANKKVLESFYKDWQTAMENWEFTNIGVKPQDDDTLRILMIGNSFCSYYTDELYHLLMENRPEGVEKVEVYNLYASGRTVTAHYNLWNDKSEGDYYLYRRVGNDRTSLTPNGGWTLEEALAVANWDYISLQGKPSSGDYGAEADLDPMCAELNRLSDPLLARFHDMFPYTQLLWHRTWALDKYSADYNSRYDYGMQYVCNYMTEEFDQDKPYDLVQVNSGAAWTEARRLNAERIAEGGEEAGLLPYGGLCAMLGRNTFGDGRANSGDGQHDGDIGGGQLLNAYMWYMTITGDSDLSDNNFKPDYEMSDELWNMLKQAAMNTYKTYYK